MAAGGAGRAEQLMQQAQVLIDANADASAVLSLLRLELGPDGAATPADTAARSSASTCSNRRRELKAKRAELRAMLARVDAALASDTSCATSRVPTAASAATSTAGQWPEAPALQLRPPVLDPREIFSEHMIERFRAEYRAARAAEPEPHPKPVLLPPLTRRPTSRGSSGTGAGGEPSLEAYLEAKGCLPRPPPPQPDVFSMTHGASRKPFAQYAGAQSLLSDAAQQPSPGRRRRIGGRASESSIGGLLNQR